MYCVKLDWQEIDMLISLVNYADPSWALWKPLIAKIRGQCECNEWQAAAHYMPDWTMMEWAYHMPPELALQLQWEWLQWEQTLPVSMWNEENNWQIKNEEELAGWEVLWVSQ